MKAKNPFQISLSLIHWYNEDIFFENFDRKAKNGNKSTTEAKMQI
jgi:hypothetical protein